MLATCDANSRVFIIFIPASLFVLPYPLSPSMTGGPSARILQIRTLYLFCTRGQGGPPTTFGVPVNLRPGPYPFSAPGAMAALQRPSGVPADLRPGPCPFSASGARVALQRPSEVPADLRPGTCPFSAPRARAALRRLIGARAVTRRLIGAPAPRRLIGTRAPRRLIGTRAPRRGSCPSSTTNSETGTDPSRSFRSVWEGP